MPARRKPLTPPSALSPLQQQLAEQLAGGATAKEAAVAIGAPLGWAVEASRSLPVLAAVLRIEHTAYQALGRRLHRLAWRSVTMLEEQLETNPALALEVLKAVGPRLAAPSPPLGAEALMLGECQERAAAIVEEQAARGQLPFPSAADTRREAQLLFDSQMERLLPVADPSEV